MVITINSSTSEVLNITEDGVEKVVPRVFTNPTYNELVGKTYQDIKRNGTQYIAFPFTQKIGSYIFILFSEGDAHGDSDRQKMARKAVADLSDTSIAWDIVTFFEDSTLVYDYSLLTPIMSDGETFVFKSWVVTKAAGVVSSQIVSTVVVSGYSDSDIDGTYALWSKPKFVGSNWYRTGYSSVGAEWNSVLFESADQVSWAIKGVLAKGIGASKMYNESDIVETSVGNYLAVIREDVGAGRPLYTCTSTDLITWTSPVLSTSIEGVQPNLIKLASGTVLLGVGDRVDRSGFDAGGLIPNAIKTTGIEIYKLPSPYSTWSVGTSIDKTWSTDGGQPYLIEHTAGSVIAAYYNSLQPTDSVTEPGVRVKMFTESNIV
jgi:hypothetical protein